ncbi:hypothetical protein HAX54_006514, partial [Datura stramonium]|nr:hypothetical protein [Datura stramonium]
MPSFAKYLKILLTKKSQSDDEEMVLITYHVSAINDGTIVEKKGDSREFCITELGGMI